MTGVYTYPQLQQWSKTSCTMEWTCCELRRIAKRRVRYLRMIGAVSKDTSADYGCVKCAAGTLALRHFILGDHRVARSILTSARKGIHRQLSANSQILLMVLAVTQMAHCRRMSSSRSARTKIQQSYGECTAVSSCTGGANNDELRGLWRALLRGVVAWICPSIF